RCRAGAPGTGGDVVDVQCPGGGGERLLQVATEVAIGAGGGQALPPCGIADDHEEQHEEELRPPAQAGPQHLLVHSIAPSVGPRQARPATSKAARSRRLSASTRWKRVPPATHCPVSASPCAAPEANTLRPPSSPRTWTRTDCTAGSFTFHAIRAATRWPSQAPTAPGSTLSTASSFSTEVGWGGTPSCTGSIRPQADRSGRASTARVPTMAVRIMCYRTRLSGKDPRDSRRQFEPRYSTGTVGGSMDGKPLCVARSAGPVPGDDRPHRAPMIRALPMHFKLSRQRRAR